MFPYGFPHNVLASQVGIGIPVLSKTPVGAPNDRSLAHVTGGVLGIPVFGVWKIVLPGKYMFAGRVLQKLQQRAGFW